MEINVIAKFKKNDELDEEEDVINWVENKLILLAIF